MYTHTLTLFQSLKHPLGLLSLCLTYRYLTHSCPALTYARKVHCHKPKKSGRTSVCNHVNSIDIHTYEYNTYTYTSIYLYGR